MKEKLRIAAGQGFWGDLPDAPVRQVEGGPIDYLMLDYLAEVTMSIMQKQKARDPNAGYARDFIPLMKRILPACVERNIKVTANAGGVNVRGCAAALIEVARALGLAGKVRIGIVTGDDIMARLDELLARGIELRNMDTGAPLSTVRDAIQSANVYLGAAPLVEALRQGAQIVITGRATDTGLTLAPLIHEFNWASDDWNHLAAGTIAGHIIECGAQASGGNCQYEWRSIPDLANVGFPIAEGSPDGTFVITKHEGTGGRVNIPSVKEQLVYEMGNPHEYITPDVVAVPTRGMERWLTQRMSGSLGASGQTDRRHLDPSGARHHRIDCDVGALGGLRRAARDDELRRGEASRDGGDEVTLRRGLVAGPRQDDAVSRLRWRNRFVVVLAGVPAILYIDAPDQESTNVLLDESSKARFDTLITAAIHNNKTLSQAASRVFSSASTLS